MIIRNAIQNDSVGLIRLTSLAPMKGRISICIAREPDFFSLLRMRGPYIALVAENDRGEIVGSFTASQKQIVIEGRPIKAYYLGDLKVHPEYTGTTVAFRLVKKMREELLAAQADLLYCTTAEGNDAISPFFSGKAGLPAFRLLSTFSVHQLLPVANSKGYREDIQPVGKEKMGQFYRDSLERYVFHPQDIHTEECRDLAITENGQIVAGISLNDPSLLKQNILINYPWTIAVLFTVLQLMKRFVRLPPIPVKNRPLRILYARYWGARKGREDKLAALIDTAREQAYQQGFHFLCIPVDEKDPVMMRLLKKWRTFNFRSHLWLASLGEGRLDLEGLKKGMCYEDFSLI